MTVVKRRLSTLPVYSELPDWCDDHDFLKGIRECVEAQKQAAEEHLLEQYKPCETASDQVSEDALRGILGKGVDVHGISRQPEISNVVVFNAKAIGGSVASADVVELRRRVDELVAAKVRETFDIGKRWGVTCSGHFWYPPGGYMGWHTNAAAPDWRLYIAYAEEPDRSFFRYRDPKTSEIVTAMDRGWSVRLFHANSDNPLWHAVYSETNRFSLGYRVHPWRPVKSISRGIKSRLGMI